MIFKRLRPEKSEKETKDKEHSLLLSKNISAGTNAGNMNAFVVTDSLNTRNENHVGPNIMQMAENGSSFVVADPGKELYNMYGRFLSARGYKVRLLASDVQQGAGHYDPVKYIRSEWDVDVLTNVFMKSTSEPGMDDDPRWQEYEKLFITALLAYTAFHAGPENRNFGYFVDIALHIVLHTVQNDDEGFQNCVSYYDDLFARLKEQEPESYALKCYQEFRNIGDFKDFKVVFKVVKIGLEARLFAMNMPELRDFMSMDDMELNMLGHEKTAVFIEPHNAGRGDPVQALLYTQAILLNFRDDFAHPVPLHIFLDVNKDPYNGTVYNLPVYLAVSRTYNTSFSVMTESVRDVETIYGVNEYGENDALSIVRSCDNVLILSAVDNTTVDWWRDVRYDHSMIRFFTLPDEKCVVWQQAHDASTGLRSDFRYKKEDHPLWPAVKEKS